MKHVCLLALLCLTSQVPAADLEPAFEWVNGGGGGQSDKTRAVCYDAQGQVFLTGEMNGDGQYGEQAVKGNGGMDCVVAKLDAQGRFLWARHLGGSLVDRGYGVVCDAAGNVYVTGHYQSTDAKVNGEVLPNAGDYDLFVAKYDGEGKLLWIRTAGGVGYDYGHGIALDSRGDVVVTGSVAGVAKFGEKELKSEGRAIFCAKYDGDGNLKWVTGTNGKASGSGHGIGVDGKDAIYLAGTVSGSGRFDEQAIEAGLTGATFLAKLHSDGKVEWLRTEGVGGGGAGIHEVAVDASGRVWVAGMFKGMFLLNKRTYMTTGAKDNDGFLAHYSPQGELLWERVLQGPQVDYCLGVATNGKGTVYVTGEFSAKATFGEHLLESRGATDVYVAALDEHGGFRWLVQAGGEKGDNAYTMAYQKGRLAVAGACVAPARFGDREMTTGRGAELYVSQLREP